MTAASRNNNVHTWNFWHCRGYNLPRELELGATLKRGQLYDFITSTNEHHTRGNPNGLPAGTRVHVRVGKLAGERWKVTIVRIVDGDATVLNLLEAVDREIGGSK